MALTELTSKDLLKTWRERINDILSEIKKYAVINHATSDTKYGLGNESKYGHLKLSDSLNSPSGKDGGVAATPYAISEVYKLANSAIRVGEKIEGTLEVTVIKGDLEGNADTATLALKAISDEYGNNINETYATKEELNGIFNGELTFDGSIKRQGTSIQWRDILTDRDSSFLYQTSYAGYMPALNLQTQDGRIGFGTYTNLCRWDYFLSSNETNSPDAYVDLLSTGLKLKGDITVDGSIIGNSTSKFNDDVYINSSSNSLIIRNDGTNSYLLISDTVNGSPNKLRPLSLDMSSGEVTMEQPLIVTSTITASDNITSKGTITANKVYNAVWNDYAEFFPRGEETEPGDIIALDIHSQEELYVKASKENHFVVGVHSDTYGHIIGGEGSIEESMKTHISVGLAGRVHAKIVGPISKGDYIVLSDIPGVGRKFDETKDSPIDIIGGAVESSEENEVKLIKIKLR